MSKSVLLTGLVWGAGSLAAYAEEATTLLPEIEVVREPLEVESPLTFSASLDALDISTPADAGDLLRRLPGIDGSRMGGHGIDPIIRGQKHRQLNILMDGAYAFGGCPNRMDPPTTLLDLDSYDSLTVIKGAQTVRYGAGGSGGTVIFERKTPRFAEAESARARFTGGLTSNADTQSASADIAIGNPLGFARALGSYRSADDYEDGSGNTVRSAYNTESAGIILGYTPSDATRVELSYDATHDWDLLFAGAGMDSPYSNTNQWRLKLDQEVAMGALQRLSGELYSVNVDHLMDNYSLRPLTAMFKMRVPTESNSAGGRIVADLSTRGTDWTLGLDYLNVTRDATRYWSYKSSSVNVPQSYMWPDVEQGDLGLFAEAEQGIGAHGRIKGGLRYDHVESSVSDVRANKAPTGPAWVMSANQLYRTYYGKTAKDATEDNLGGFLSYGHDLGNDLELTAGVSRTLRTADATERYLASNGNPASMRWVGNPDLDPEQHHQLDLTLAKTGAAWRTDLALFYDRVTDYILRDRAHGQSGILRSDNATIYRNVDAELTGGEWSGEIEFAQHWQAGASLAYVYAQNRTDGRAIAQIPPLSGILKLDYRQDLWAAGAQVTWANTQDRVDDDPMTGSGLDVGETAGWWVLDLYGQVKLGRQGELRLGVDNVFDRTYAYHVNRANVDPFNPQAVQVNEPGRTVWARASVAF
ncbi:TonB-dependent copper receptor [Thiorhodococcus minor]|uniref:TonB-dependent copper receptor n=1 Tax=Thiorhodococcus minor TaxID=57489 RepID=A0A6M0JYP5_9GAMM|nr:TonB-dependent copper receptor [Thiorhodococcus minor]NEV62151.1 TonB-dependent copper receptor [Thiorhodococcus minor]